MQDDLDPQSKVFLQRMIDREKVKGQLIANIRTVLVVLSSRGMVFDMESLRQKILLTYPEAAVFLRNTDGKTIGAASPAHVDLLIDFTGPGQRQGWFYAKTLRRLARVAVGRNAGLFRKKAYDRVFDEKSQMATLPRELLERERLVQKEVLGLAGVAFVPVGDTPPDRGKSIALELPPMQRLG
jgi:hypothetical protein